MTASLNPIVAKSRPQVVTTLNFLAKLLKKAEIYSLKPHLFKMLTVLFILRFKSKRARMAL